MVTVPYVVLGVVGFLIYRGVKKNAEFLANQSSQAFGEQPETRPI